MRKVRLTERAMTILRWSLGSSWFLASSLIGAVLLSDLAADPARPMVAFVPFFVMAWIAGIFAGAFMISKVLTGIIEVSPESGDDFVYPVRQGAPREWFPVAVTFTSAVLVVTLPPVQLRDAVPGYVTTMDVQEPLTDRGHHIQYITTHSPIVERDDSKVTTQTT